MGMHYSFIPQNLTERRQNAFALVIFLPAAFDEVILPIRERFDPLYNHVPTHLAITAPFESNMSVNELGSIIKHEAEVTGSILVELGSIGDNYPDVPEIYWGVRKNPKLLDLSRRVHANLELPVPEKGFTHYVTVAREISMHRLYLVKEQIIPYLPDESFHASAIDLIAPLPGSQKWVSVRSFSLTRNPI